MAPDARFRLEMAPDARFRLEMAPDARFRVLVLVRQLRPNGFGCS